jgi:glycosyltransferase involved in cell wall biosynthesis
MMATGGINLVAPNGGNIEYLKDEYNCLFYEQGNIDMAIEQIDRIINDKELRDKLVKNGLETAKERSWDKIETKIIKLYSENE